jgi:hypothetical protein
VVAFDNDASLVIACLWRLVDSGRLRITSDDDGHQFGLQSPVDAVTEVNRCLAGASLDVIDLRERLLDLDFRFSTGHVLQIIPNSAGYEAWNLSRGSRQIIAVGGGEVVIFGGDERGEV